MGRKTAGHAIAFRGHPPPGRARAEGEGEIMALRDPEIPNHRERSALQAMIHGNWVGRSDLYPAEKGTIASLVRKGWIEQRVDPPGAEQFRITQAGRAPLPAKIR
jgi:hypothetical protein